MSSTTRTATIAGHKVEMKAVEIFGGHWQITTLVDGVVIRREDEFVGNKQQASGIMQANILRWKKMEQQGIDPFWDLLPR